MTAEPREEGSSDLGEKRGCAKDLNFIYLFIFSGISLEDFCAE